MHREPATRRSGRKPSRVPGGKAPWIIAIVLSVPLALACAAMLVLESRWFSDYLSGRLSEQWDRRVAWSGSLDIDWSLHPTINVTKPRVANADWAQPAQMVRAQTVSAQIDLLAVFEGLVRIERLQLIQPAVHLARSQSEGPNWSFLISEEPKKKPLLQPRFEAVLVQEGLLTYSVPWRNTNIRVSINGPQGEQLRVRGDGQLLGEPVQLRLTGDPLRQAVDKAVGEDQAPDSYALQGMLRWQDHKLTLDGQADSITSLGELQFQANLSGPNADALADIFGYQTKAAPYRIAGKVSHQRQRWSLSALDGHIGGTNFDGHLAYDTSGERPAIVADVQVDALDISEMLPAAVDQGEPKKQESGPLAQRLEQWTAPLRQFNLDATLNFGRLSLGRFTVEDVAAEAQLNSGNLSLEPVAFDIGGGRVALVGKLDAARAFPSGTATLTLEAVDLGQALAPLGYENLAQVQGNLTAEIREGALVPGKSHVRYWTKDTGVDITTDIESRQTAEGFPGFRLEASGEVEGHSLAAQLLGGPVVSLSHPQEAYPFSLNADFAETHLLVDGTLTQPLSLEDADLQLQASGPDPAQLRQLIGVAVPHLPPYKVRAHLLREDTSWYLRDINVELGNSHLAGNIRWRTYPDKRPMLWADLRSQTLNLEDLTPQAENGSETAASAPQQEADAQQQDEDVLPEGEILQKRLQALNAEVEFDGKQLRAAGIPLDTLTLDLSLQNGLLHLRPVALGIGPGRVKLNMTLDGTAMPATGSADLELSRVSLQRLTKPSEIADDTGGVIGGRGHFEFRGSSVASALAGLDGDMRLLMNGGQLDPIVVEAIGLDLGESLFSLFGDKPDPVEILCGYTELAAEDGLVNIEALTLATSDSNIVGDGRINLAKEEFEVTIEAKPKDFSLLSGSSPIRLHGSFKDPKVDAISRELIGRGLLAAIGAAVFPPAALLPLAETGETSGQGGCQDYVAAAD